VPLHVIQRGNNRSACFFAREDYSYYLENLAELAGKHHCAVHAYCLMTNHVHLLLTPGDFPAPGNMMKALGQRYVQYVNRTWRELFRRELPSGVVDQIRQATNGNFTLGNQRFIAEVEAALGRRAAKGTPGRPSKSKDHKP
jgi:REP element-mobilizing transposase RayT